MKKYFLCLLVTSAAYADSLDLATVRTTATTQRPLLKAQAQTITHAKHLERKAIGAYLPQLSTSHTSSFSQEHSTIDKSTHTLSLTGRQLIFSLNGPQLQRKIASMTTEQARHAFTATSNQAEHDAIHAFLDAWLLQEKHAVIDRLSSYADRLSAQVNAKQLSGVLSAADALAQQATVAQHQATVSSYEHEHRAARAQLRTALGGQYAVDATPLSFTPGSLPQLQPLSEYLALAYAYRPELKEKKAAIEQHRLTARSHHLSYLPSVHLHGSVGRTFSGTGPERGTDANIGITASWQFFDGMQQRAAANAADAHKMRAEFELQELRNRITQEVTTAYHILHATLAALRAALASSKAQGHITARDETAATLGALDSVESLKQSYLFAQSLHDLVEKQVTLRKQLETLRLVCGWPAIALFKETA